MGLQGSIRTKLILVYLALAIPLAGLLGYGLYDRYQDQIKLIYEEREDIAKITATNLVGFVRGVSATIDTSGHAIYEAKMPPPAANIYLANIKHNYPAIISIAYVSPTGEVIACQNQKMIGKNISSHACVEEVRNGKDVGVGRYRQHLNGSYGFAIASDIREDGRLVAIMVALIDPQELGPLMPALGTGCSNIVDSNGTLIFQSQHPDLAYRYRQWGKIELVKNALDGNTASTDNFICPKDKKRHFAVEVPVKEFGWAAGSGIETDDALAYITEDAMMVAPFYILLFLLASGLAFFIGSTISSPLIALSKQARLIGEEKLDEPIAINSTGEIGDLAKELDTARTKLSSSFTSMNLLFEASSSLNRSLDLADVTTTLSEKLTRLLRVDRVAVATFDHIAGEIVILNSNHPLCPHPGERHSLHVLPALFSELYSEKHPVIVTVNGQDLSDTDRAFFEAREVKSMLLYPLLIGERIIGHITLAESTRVHTFTERDLQMVNGIAAQAAIAIENARLYEKEHDIAETLQQALLTVPPKLTGVEVDHIYEAAMGLARVGGDFYDLFEIDVNTIGFVIGDVAGKGLRAATVTSMVKSTMKAFTYAGLDMAGVLSKTNDALCRQIDRNQFITAILGVLDTTTGYLQFINAGHPDIIVRGKNNGCTVVVSERNVPLGAFCGIEFDPTQIRLTPGDSIFLYTDGLVEAKRDGQLFGDQRVVEIIRRMQSASNQEILNELVKAAKEFAGGNLIDDMAIVSIKLKERSDRIKG